MTLKFIIKISIITILYYVNSAYAYEFRANNETFLNSIINEAIDTDIYDTNHSKNIIPKKHVLIIITKRDNNTKELKTSTENKKRKHPKGYLRSQQLLGHKPTKKTETKYIFGRQKKKKKLDKVQKNYIAMHHAERVRRINEARVKEVAEFMKFSYKATEYLYSEVKRILSTREILDRVRHIVFDVENSHNKTFIRAMTKCLYMTADAHVHDQWGPLPNKITWHNVLTPDNDGAETILLTGASLTASLLVVQVAVLPLLFKYSKSIQRKMVFSNCINYPRNLDYENPSSCNVVGGRNFSIEFQSKVDNCPIKLGAWHIVPCSMFRDVFVIRDYMSVDARLHEELRKTHNTIVLYCHGNSNHRASPHRLQMYKVFQDLNMHVITFDYRGYGDSTRIRPTERGVVEDALAVYGWLHDSLDQDNRPLVVVWGHSLGTAVAANMSAHLEELCREQGRSVLPIPDAVVLEAPFNNLMDEIEYHPFSKLVSWLPYYKESFVKPFGDSEEYAFNTDEYLCCCPRLPILMLHSKSDKIVPYCLAVKLHEKILSSRGTSNAPVVFHPFERGLGLGHNNLCEAPELKDVVEDFLKLVVAKRQEMQSRCCPDETQAQ